MTFVRIRRAVLASLLLCGGGACSSPAPGTNPDGSGAGTGGSTAGTGGTGGSSGTGGRVDAGSGGSVSGSGGQSGAGGASGTGGKAGSGGASGAGGSGTGGSPDAGPRDTPGMELRVAPAMPTFATHVAPIIAVKCAPCHTTEAKAGNNWNYDNLVTNSTVTNTNAACGPGEVAEPGLGGNAPRDCKYMEGNGKRVTPGPSFETSLLYIKIMVEDGRLCDQSCGQQMPPTNSGKSLDTYERDIFKNWMKNGAPR